MTRIGADTPLWQTDLYMAVFGLGLGMNMQSIVLAMQNAVDPRDMGVATSSVTFFRQVGGSLGTAVFLSILFTSAELEHPARAREERGAGTAGPEVRPQQHQRSASSFPAAVKHPILVGFSDAMDLVFLVGALVLLIGVVLSWLLKEVPLRNVSGQQARREAAEEAAAADAANLSLNDACDEGGATVPAKGKT